MSRINVGDAVEFRVGKFARYDEDPADGTGVVTEISTRYSGMTEVQVLVVTLEKADMYGISVGKHKWFFMAELTKIE